MNVFCVAGADQSKSDGPRGVPFESSCHRSHPFLRFLSRVFAAELGGPSRAMVRRLLPYLLHFVRADANDPNSIDDRLAVRSLAGPGKLSRARRDLAIDEDVHAALVVSEHPVPALIVRIVAKPVFSCVAASSVPGFDNDAFVEHGRNGAFSGGRRSGTSNVPIAKPEIECTALRVCGTRPCRGSAVDPGCQADACSDGGNKK